MVKTYSTSVPRRDLEREKNSSGSGPVTHSKMSPEELEDYRARTGYKGPSADAIAPVSTGIELQPNPNSKVALDKDEALKQSFLQSIAAGNTIAATERAMGLKVNVLAYRVKKWGLVGITPGKARELLGIKQEPENPEVQNASLANYEKELARLQQIEQDLQLTIYENEKLKDELAGANASSQALCDEIKQVREQCADYKEKLAIWNGNDLETQELLLVITNERDQREREVVELKYDLAEMTEDRNNWMQTAQEAKQAIVELQAEYNQQPSLIVDSDNVNHPSHYTAGGIETIEFIRAKLTPAEFEGYCKGNVLKYVSRASHKGGQEDLLKAGKYIEFAVGGH